MKQEKKEKSRVLVNLILRIILWVILLLAALFPAKYINSVYGYLAFFFLALLLLVSQIILALQKKHLSVEHGTEDREAISCVRGEPVDLSLRLKNGSWFFCSHASADFFISDLFGDADVSRKVDFTIAGKSESSFAFDMDMKHIGVYHVGIRKVRLYDMFSIFYREIPVNGEFDVYVKPRIYALEDLEIEEEVSQDSDRDSRNMVPNGTDYVGVREYELGDSMKQIHWKLSAHSVNYMTKLSESSRQSDFAVVLDTAANEADREELMTIYDTLVETVFSVLEELSHREVTYSLIYPDKQQEIRRSVPKGRDNDMEYIRRFDAITADPVADYPDGAQFLEQEAKMPNRCTNLILCTSRLTTELIQQLLSMKRQKRNPELYVIIPERLTQRERETMFAPLAQLDDALIPWHVVSTARNQQVGNAGEAGAEE